MTRMIKLMSGRKYTRTASNDDSVTDGMLILISQKFEEDKE